MERHKIADQVVPTASTYSGYCITCKKNHVFPGNYDLRLGYSLMEELKRENRIDRTVSTNSLFGELRGKMFGVMTCISTDGVICTVKAFSGQFDGRWQIPGWAPPLFDVERWHQVNTPEEKAIKDLDGIIRTGKVEEKERLIQMRRHLSRALMKDLHALYRLTNFSGKTASFSDIFSDGSGIPTGTGDCCAPKLLNYAALHKLIPVSLCEFYWGRDNKSGTRSHGSFYPPCDEKCAPLMGFMLCGLKELYEQANL